QREERRDVIGYLAARQRQLIAGVDLEAGYCGAEGCAPARAREVPRREAPGRAHPTPEPVIRELKHARAGRLRALDLVGLRAIKKDAFPGMKRRDAPGLAYLDLAGAQ